MNGFLTDDFNRTGRAGIMIDIGKGRRKFSNRKDKSKNIRFSNHNTLSLDRENLKEGR
jgi:hypothetical protein